MTDTPKTIWITGNERSGSWNHEKSDPKARLSETEYVRKATIPRPYRMDDPDNPPPKDGTEFMGWSSDGDFLPRCSWQKPYWQTQHHWQKRRRRKAEEMFCVWCQVDHDGIEGWENASEITHWMPQPEPPRENE